MIEILSSGASNSVQDLGRSGYLNSGVSRSGAMDRDALIIANRMIGNTESAAGLEIAIHPFRLRFLADMAFAVTGSFGTIAINNESRPGWWAAMARKGDVLTLHLPEAGARTYLAFAGGIDIPRVLKSCATDLKSGFGGLGGRGLQRGDILATGNDLVAAKAPAGSGFGINASTLRPGAFGPSRSDIATIQVIPAVEEHLFTDEARTAFYEDVWTVSAEANRQGCRLDGPSLHLKNAIELFSHGIMPGTIQVPPSGQPVIQLAEANTCGGYPKIACVITADLWKLAQAKTGQKLRFCSVSTTEAVEALKFQNKLIADMGILSQLARRDRVKETND
jgi:biotin-dependent carboxylase-like uncharacterized protein